jgi:putative endonuclease
MFKIFSKKRSYDLGKEAEDKAAKFLKKSGLDIIDRNYHSRFGEIDIIAEDNKIIHFVEVKASLKYDALERITNAKMAKILKTIEYYILQNDIKKDYQIDAVIINNDKIEWIKNIIY